MTPTEKQKCIAEQAVYGDLEIVPIEGYAPMLFDKGTSLPYHNGYKFNKCLPVLRPITDLTKTITHKGYNNDQPFIPLEALAPHFDMTGYENDLEDTGIEPYLALEYATYTGHHFARLDLLHQWHFDTRNLISQGEAVDSNTLTRNPYEVGRLAAK